MSSDLLELCRSSVPLLQEMLGRGAARGLQSITTRPFLAPRSLGFTGFHSNEGAPAEKTTHSVEELAVFLKIFNSVSPKAQNHVLQQILTLNDEYSPNTLSSALAYIVP